MVFDYLIFFEFLIVSDSNGKLTYLIAYNKY